jgi:hypothetical protein
MVQMHHTREVPDLLNRWARFVSLSEPREGA